MAITGEHIKEFRVYKFEETTSSQYNEIFSQRLVDTQAKHIAYIDSKTEHLHKLSIAVEYNIDIIGSHRNTVLEDERQRILNMKNSDCLRAARFVICEDGRIWADNTHWTISYTMRFGNDVTIRDIPAYIVDFRSSIPTIVEHGNVLFDSMFCIKSAIACAKRIQDRVNNGWRPIDISFTINDLINNLYNK